MMYIHVCMYIMGLYIQMYKKINGHSDSEHIVGKEMGVQYNLYYIKIWKGALETQQYSVFLSSL